MLLFVSSIGLTSRYLKALKIWSTVMAQLSPTDLQMLEVGKDVLIPPLKFLQSLVKYFRKIEA